MPIYIVCLGKLFITLSNMIHNLAEERILRWRAFSVHDFEYIIPFPFGLQDFIWESIVSKSYRIFIINAFAFILLSLEVYYFLPLLSFWLLSVLMVFYWSYFVLNFWGFLNQDIYLTHQKWEFLSYYLFQQKSFFFSFFSFYHTNFVLILLW